MRKFSAIHLICNKQTLPLLILLTALIAFMPGELEFEKADIDNNYSIHKYFTEGASQHLQIGKAKVESLFEFKALVCLH